MFGGKHAGFVTMPAPSKTVSVDEARLLAWAEKTCPHHVETTEEPILGGSLIRYLRENAPHFLRPAKRLDPQFVTDLTTAMKAKGYYVTADGEKITEVPGVVVGESEPAPRVNLSEDAGQIIGAAWRAGDIPVADLLALPAGEAGQ